MSYASTGLIQATDYNAMAWGGTQGTYTASPTNIAYVMGVGASAVGYGQDVTAINTVAAAGTVTATQWSGLLTTLNKALGHQSGAGAQLSVPTITAGGVITYAATVATAVTTINTNAALYAANGSTLTGTTFTTAISSTTGVNQSIYRSVTFPSTQAARYFFNAGGYLNYYTSVTGGTGSAANNSLTNMVNAIGGLTGFRNTANNGRTGSGLTLNTNNTAFGYRNLLLNAGTNVIYVTDTAAAYTADNAQLIIWTNNNDATSGANGPTVIFELHINVADHSWDDSISCTVNTRVDVVYPESTYLTTNSWGTPSIT